MSKKKASEHLSDVRAPSLLTFGGPAARLIKLDMLADLIGGTYHEAVLAARALGIPLIYRRGGTYISAAALEDAIVALSSPGQPDFAFPHVLDEEKRFALKVQEEIGATLRKRLRNPADPLHLKLALSRLTWGVLKEAKLREYLYDLAALLETEYNEGGCPRKNGPAPESPRGNPPAGDLGFRPR